MIITPFMTAAFRLARSAERPVPETPTTGRDQLSADVPDLVIEEDETTGLPNRIVSRQPSGRLSAPGPSDPGDAVRQFIQDRRAVWNLAEEDAAAVEVRSVSRTGLKTAKLYQSVDGVEVFDSDVTVALDDGQRRDLNIRAVLPRRGRRCPGVPHVAGADPGRLDRPGSVRPNPSGLPVH